MYAVNPSQYRRISAIFSVDNVGHSFENLAVAYCCVRSRWWLHSMYCGLLKFMVLQYMGGSQN